MKPGIAAGAVAGAVGTLALDVVSYADMLLTARSASDLPGRAAARLVETVGIDLGDDDDPRAANRRTALGAILGYSTGVAIGGVLGLAWRRHPERPAARRGLGAAATAMVVANGPMVAQGLTDPRTWGARGWASDIVPHVAYGVAAAATYRAVTDRTG